MPKHLTPQTILANIFIGLLCMTGILVIFGWHGQSISATTFHLGTANMKYNSALAFIGLAIGLVAIQSGHLILQKAIASAIIALALLTLLQSLLSHSIGIDQLIVADVWESNNPGRMGSINALLFLLGGVLLYTHHDYPHTRIWLYDNLLTAYLLVPLFAVFSHIFAPEEIVGNPVLNTLALHTSACYLFFVLALMLLTHSKGGAGLLTRDTRHGANFRALFFLVLVLPLTLGSVLRYAIDQQWIGAGVGIAIFCLFSTSLTVISLAHHTIVLDHWVKRLLGQRRISYLLQQQIHELIEIADDGILLFNGDLKILHANTGAERILGYERDDFKNLYLEQLMPAHKSNAAYIELDNYIRSTNSPQSLSLPNQLNLRHKSGKDIPVSVSLTKKKHLDETLLVAIIKNMSKLDNRLKTLEKQAFVDPLTQTLNRAALHNFSERMSIHELRKSDNTFCVMLMDIDDFKSINDSYGHDAGDQVLVEFAKAIKSVLRNGDRLFRTGGEEFVIITANLEEEDALLFAERVLNVVRATKIDYQNIVLNVTCSIGVCVVDTGQKNINEAIKRADHAMYQAKRSGKNKVMLAPASQAADQLNQHFAE